MRNMDQQKCKTGLRIQKYEATVQKAYGKESNDRPKRCTNATIMIYGAMFDR